MHVVIFTGGSLEKGCFVSQALSTADLIIAADQGAQTAFLFGYMPKAVIGDLDSLQKTIKKQLEEKGVTFITSDAHKDETDTELAITYAVQKGAKRITILGGTQGNRLDHVIANVLLTVLSDIPVKFVNGSQEMWTAKGPRKITIRGMPSDLLSLISLTPKVEKIQTSSLAYPLQNKSLYLGKPTGTSNVFLKKQCSIQFEKGLLLLVHTRLTK